MHALLVFTGVLGKLLSMTEIQLDVQDITILMLKLRISLDVAEIWNERNI